MFSVPASIVAAMRRALSVPHSFESAGDAEPSGTALREMIFKAAGQSLGECPPWLLIAIEQAGRETVHRRGLQERMPPC
ncbi:MAG: hypothetical protein WBG88_10160 [Mesorhizobium sp.]